MFLTSGYVLIVCILVKANFRIFSNSEVIFSKELDVLKFRLACS